MPALAASGDRDASNVSPALIECRGMVKEYPGVLALDKVDFRLLAGEVHVLFGENGAGKSTLISLLAGAQQPTLGDILVRGAPVKLHSVHRARALGISAVFQEFSLVPQMTIEENLFLGAEPKRRGFLDRQTMRREAEAILSRLGFALDPSETVQHLTRAQRQMVEIAKAFRTQPSVLIFDEPTASLTEKETEQLFRLIASATAQGVGVIYITHRMAEIRRVGDRVTVLRDGKAIATVDAKATSEDRLVELMTGRVIDEIYPTIPHRAGEVVLKIEQLSTLSHSVRDATIDVHAGEVVGIAGLVGSGKSEIARACFGLEAITSGKVWLRGEDVTSLPPRTMLKKGFFYLPPDRREEGLMMMRSCRENIVLPALRERPIRRGGFLDITQEQSLIARLVKRINLQPASPERDVGHFSGGNQQKVLLAKSLSRSVQVFVFDDPTTGVDVATRAAIYRFIGELCEAGAAVLLVSSDLPEVLHLSHRLYVMYSGRIQAEFSGTDITEQNVLSYFFERQVAA
ncbi:MAG: sugar ABC transporter ATP-binding protein [Proteobacteria bacterium]|nr:MAG: sugar ABC transporter ATP-binding protein [Pseudomonadota bacterium]